MDEQLEFIKQISERLTSAGLEYMMTGSMAAAVYATPRMTRDVDMVLECSTGDVDTIVSLFSPDCYIERTAVAEAVAERGMFNIIHNEWIIKADFIIRKDDPFRVAEFARRRVVDVEGTRLSVVAPEDLILSKLVWARETGSELQRRDAHAVLRAGIQLDRAYLDEWAIRLGLKHILETLGS
jgi:hypothetical protein